MKSRRFDLWLDLYDDIDLDGNDDWHLLKVRIVNSGKWAEMLQTHQLARFFDRLEIP
ncbi:hypothetical protein [Nocardia nova]|uniref:hypothetical protein n=1 Tax=Nocardia nova TaxID=37330 RepID=UPI002739C1E1|nr:hypothetical protein [Nocardia nova]